MILSGFITWKHLVPSSWRNIIAHCHRAYQLGTNQHCDTTQHSCSHLSASTFFIMSYHIKVEQQHFYNLWLQKYVTYDSSLNVLYAEWNIGPRILLCSSYKMSKHHWCCKFHFSNIFIFKQSEAKRSKLVWQINTSEDTKPSNAPARKLHTYLLTQSDSNIWSILVPGASWENVWIH